MQPITPDYLGRFSTDLTKVASGESYLRVKKNAQGQLCYEAVGKKTGWSGFIQYFQRLFDSSYNINNAFALLAEQFKTMPESIKLGTAARKLRDLGEALNQKSVYHKIDLTPLDTITQEAANKAMRQVRFPPKPPS